MTLESTIGQNWKNKGDKIAEGIEKGLSALKSVGKANWKSGVCRAAVHMGIASSQSDCENNKSLNDKAGTYDSRIQAINPAQKAEKARASIASISPDNVGSKIFAGGQKGGAIGAPRAVRALLGTYTPANPAKAAKRKARRKR